MKIIFVLLMLFLISVNAEEPKQVYVVNLILDENQNVNLEDIYLSTSFQKRDFLTGPYTLRLVSEKEKTLHIDKFDFNLNVPPAEWFDNTGKQIVFPEEIEKRKVTLIVPYFEEAREMHIYDPSGKLTLDIDLAKFCKGDSCLRKKEIDFEKPLIILIVAIVLLIGYWLYKKKVK